jgi:hypothetical protein
MLLSSLQKVFLIYATPKLFAPRVPAGQPGLRGGSPGIAIQNREAIPAKGWAKCDVSLERGDDHNPKLRYEANSMAILVANETVWAADAEKTQNRQRCD